MSALPIAISGSSGVEHFARVVSPRGWKDVRIQMLTVCFDASGKTPSTTTTKKRGKNGSVPDSLVMAVAGFASQAGVWAELEDKWQSVLSRYSVTYFHAGDFASCHGPFEIGWRGEEQKKRDFQSELMGVIEDCGLRKFGSLLWVSDLQKAKAMMGLATDSTASPYVLCARAAVEDFNAVAISEGQRESIEYIFEKGDEEDKLRQHFRKHSFHEPLFRWCKPVEKKGIIQQPFIGLQAAGWIVWEYYMAFSRSFQQEYSHYPYPPERWALKIFDDHRRVPGEVKILYKSSPFLHLLRNYSASFLDLSGAIAEATARLESAKRAGLVDGG
jgi:hypothetical protein